MIFGFSLQQCFYESLLSYVNELIDRWQEIKKKKNRNSETISLTLVIHFYEFCNTLQSRPDISHTPTDPQRVSFSLVLLETLERSFLSSFTLAPFLLISLSS